MSPTAFDEAAKRLAKLPRADRFDELLEFPHDFTFKAIGRGDSFFDDVRGLLDTNGFRDTILVERASSSGRFVSISFKIAVADGAEIDRIYTLLEGLPKLAYLL